MHVLRKFPFLVSHYPTMLRISLYPFWIFVNGFWIHLIFPEDPPETPNSDLHPQEPHVHLCSQQMPGPTPGVNTWKVHEQTNPEQMETKCAIDKERGVGQTLMTEQIWRESEKFCTLPLVRWSLGIR